MNKHERKKAPGFSNFGFPTILLSFVMICIATISALSLLTANSDYKLSQKVAEKNTAYYDAEKKAYDTLADIDALLAKAYSDSNSANTYYKEVESSLQSLDYGTYDRTTGFFTYEVTISDNQDLQVGLYIHYPTEMDDSFYEITTWKSVYDVIEPEEEILDLID